MYYKVGQVDRVSCKTINSVYRKPIGDCITGKFGKLPDRYESRGIVSVKLINNVVLPEQRAKI